MSVALVWFRRDLRLQDNPALQAALDAGHDVVPVYIHAPHEEGEWAPGAASDAWRHRSLAALDADLRTRGSSLVLRSGDSLPALQLLIAQTGAEAVYWNRKYEPATQPRDATIKRMLREQGIDAQSCNGSLLFEPWDIATQQGQPYKVFTPYWRNVLSHWRLPALQAAPEALAPHAVDSLALDDLQLAPTLDWDTGFWEHWQPGEAGALEALSVFEDGALRGYREQRDLPDRVGTSRLSPHLHFGEIAPWRIAHALEGLRSPAPTPTSTATCASWAGVTSPTTCCITSRRRPLTTSTRVSIASHGQRPVRRSCTPGSAATPACRSSMPGFASCGTPATCTTGCG